MGGYGSGRPRWRGSCEYSLWIDIRRLAREKLLIDGTSFHWRWNNNANSSISIRAGQSCLLLLYSIDGENREQHIGIAQTACHFGGNRPWFRCPCCWNRVAKLYLRARRFACRQCNRLGYLIENQDYGQRQWMKAERIERILGEDLERPKGMHLSTYERLLNRYYAIHEARDIWFDSRLLRLLRLV